MHKCAITKLEHRLAGVALNAFSLFQGLQKLPYVFTSYFNTFCGYSRSLQTPV